MGDWPTLMLTGPWAHDQIVSGCTVGTGNTFARQCCVKPGCISDLYIHAYHYGCHVPYWPIEGSLRNTAACPLPSSVSCLGSHLAQR